MTNKKKDDKRKSRIEARAMKRGEPVRSREVWSLRDEYRVYGYIQGVKIC